jgi:hypothetical protein
MTGPDTGRYRPTDSDGWVSDPRADRYGDADRIQTMTPADHIAVAALLLGREFPDDRDIALATVHATLAAAKRP